MKRELVDNLLGFMSENDTEVQQERDSRLSMEDLMNDPQMWEDETNEVTTVNSLEEAVEKASHQGFECVYRMDGQKICHLLLQKSSGNRRLQPGTDNEMQPAIILQQISVKPSARNKGLATKIISDLRNVAAKMQPPRGLLVQSVTSEYIHKICKKLKFHELGDGSYGAPLSS